MKKVTLIIIAFIAGFIISVLAQKDQKLLHRQWYEEAERLYNLDEPTPETDSTALLLFLKTAAAASGNDYPLSIECFIKAGNIYQGQQLYAAANNLYHTAIYLNNTYGKSPAATYEAGLYLGSSLYFSNIIDSAQYYFEMASDIALTYKDKESLPEKATLYNSLGTIYFESANFLQAKNYFERALEFSPKTADDYEDLYTGIQSNIANCLMKLNRHDSALRIFQSLTQNVPQKNIIRQNTAHCYFELGEYDSALSIYQSLPVQNGLAGVVALTDMGRIYMKRKQWQQAEVVFDSAIARNKSISLNIKNKEEALACLYRSQLADEQGLPDEALTWINEALKEVHLNFVWAKAEDLPADISQTVSPITLFNVLHAKARLLFKKYNRTQQLNYLAASLSAYIKAIETANFIKLNFDNDEAKLFFNENYRPIYTEAIEAAYLAAAKNDDYKDDYLFIIENYKGNILHQNLQNILLKSTAQIPDSIRRREKEIKQLMAFYTSRINRNAVEKDAEPLQKRLLSLQVELSRLQKKYEQDATYNRFKYRAAENKLTLTEIQNGLESHTALINYFTGDSAVYCLVVTKKNSLLQKIKTDSLFHQSFRSFIDEIYHYEEGKRYEGFAASATLYSLLIEPLESVTGGAVDKWVIIPDGFLYYLPFEALVKNPGKKDYLMLSKTISYHYSFALLFGKNTHHYSTAAAGGSVGFVPYALKDKNIIAGSLSDLPLSANELTEMSKNIYTGHHATKKRFLIEASKYPVVHLATHASAGADNSSNWIQFYPTDSSELNNKLYLHEIYDLDMHRAELVILSACETGGGVTATGEGLLSLSRAFMYAGADGIVSTLWKTEDRVTAFLMQRMHVYLKKKVSPEKALQLAKKDLLDDNTLGSQYKTPDYWANFIYVGKLHSQTGINRGLIWKVLTGAAIVIILFFLFRRKKKPHQFTVKPSS